MADFDMAPLVALAASMAYVAEADGGTGPEEKAKLLALLGKMVTRGDIEPEGLKRLVAKGFDIADRVDLRRFLDDVTPKLTAAQKLSIYANVFETMLADGSVCQGEVEVVRRFEAAFNIDDETRKAVREMIELKNDTRLFTEKNHPRNDPAYTLRLVAMKGMMQ